MRSFGLPECMVGPARPRGGADHSACPRAWWGLLGQEGEQIIRPAREHGGACSAKRGCRSFGLPESMVGPARPRGGADHSACPRAWWGLLGQEGEQIIRPAREHGGACSAKRGSRSFGLPESMVGPARPRGGADHSACPRAWWGLLGQEGVQIIRPAREHGGACSAKRGCIRPAREHGGACSAKRDTR